MNHRGAEFAEKKKRNYDSPQPTRGYRVLLLLFCLGGFIFWILPILNLGIHYIQWNLQGIEEYELYFSEAGIILPIGSTEIRSLDIVDENGIVRLTKPVNVFKPEFEAIDTIFRTALSRILNPFQRCSVRYHEQYRIPNHISCGSLQGENGGWWYVEYFQPITHN